MMNGRSWTVSRILRSNLDLVQFGFLLAMHMVTSLLVA